jgi:hypothetical protein
MQFQVSSVVALASLAVGSSALAGLTSLHGTGPIADGVYAGSAFSAQPWSVDFQFSGPLDSAASEADFGDWTFKLSNGSVDWSISGSGAESGVWKNIGSNRIFTITLMSGTTSGGSTLSPAPTEVSIVYTATRASGSWGTLAAALTASQGTNFEAVRGGFLIKTGASGTPGAGSIASGYSFAVPAPGAAALLGMAGLLARKRRRPHSADHA